MISLPFKVDPGVADRYVTEAGYINSSFVVVEDFDGLRQLLNTDKYRLRPGTPIFVNKFGKIYKYVENETDISKLPRFDFLTESLTEGSIYGWKDNEYYDLSSLFEDFASKEDLEALKKEILDSFSQQIADLTNKLNKEIDDRESADLALKKEVQDYLVTLQNNISIIENNLSAEITRATNEEQAIKGSLNTEIGRATQAEFLLDQKIDDASNSLNKRIDDEITTRELTDEALSKAITGERERAEGVEDSLNKRVGEGFVDGQGGIQSLTDRVKYDEDQHQSDFLDLQGQIGADREKLDEEIRERTTEDAALNSRIDTEEANRQAGDSAISKKVDDEITAREAADTTLQENIDTEASERKAADDSLNQAIQDEATARETQDNYIQSQIGSGFSSDEGNTVWDRLQKEVEDRTSEDTRIYDDLNKKISDEAATRVSEDKRIEDSLQQEIDDALSKHDEEIENLRVELKQYTDTEVGEEAERATGREDTLQTAIDNEVTRATNRENELEEKINTDVGAEASAREQADTALENKINALETKHDDDVERIEGEISSSNEGLQRETENREAADKTLQDNIDTEATERKAADTTLQGNIDTEKSRALQAEKDLDTAIKAETSRAKGVEGVLSDLKTDEQGNLVGAINEVVDELAAEIENRKAADGDLTQLETEDTSNLVSAINSLKQYTDTQDSTLSGRIDTTNTNLTAEIDRAKKAEQANTSAITTEVNRAKGVEGDLSTLNDTIQSKDNLASAINDVDNRLEAEIARAKAAEGDTTTLETEATNLTDAVNEVLGKVNQEVEDREAADTALKTELQKEISDLEQSSSSEIKALQKALEEETANRETADSNLKTNLEKQIQDETTARENADNDINSSIQDINERIGEGFTSENTVAKAIEDAKTAALDAVEKEKTRAEAAEKSLQDSIGAEASTRQSEDDKLSTAITAETTNREAGDKALQDQLGEGFSARKTVQSEVERLESEITSNTSDLEQKIADEKSRAEAAEKANASAITSESTRAQGAEKDLQDQLGAGFDETNTVAAAIEVAKKEASDAVSAEETRATGAEEALGSRIDELEKSSGADITDLQKKLSEEVERAKQAESEKVDIQGGELKDTVVTFEDTAEAGEITSGDTTGEIVAKIKKTISDLGDLAYKDTVATADIDNAAVTPEKLKDSEKYIRTGDALLPNDNFGGKRIYIDKIDDFLFAAHKRWPIKAEIYSAETDEKISDVSESNVNQLFSGRVNTGGINVSQGQYAKITFDFTNGGKQAYFPSYPYGYFYLCFYAGRISELQEDGLPHITARVYQEKYTAQGTGWHDLVNGGNISVAPATTMIASFYNKYYGIEKLEFNVYGKGTENNDSVATGITCLSEIELWLDRDVTAYPFVSKYWNETLYYNLDAPTFSENGVKLENKYAKKTDLVAEQNRATTEEGKLSGRIDAEQKRAEAAEKKNTDAIAAEEARAKGTEGDLTKLNEGLSQDNLVTAINSENERAKSVEGNLTDLSEGIDQTNLVAAINSVQKSASSSGENLKSLIDAEQKRAEGKEKELSDKIAAETTRAEAAEGDLDNLTTDAKNSLVEAINEIDSFIPDNASTDNLLATRSFVNSSIQASAARFLTPTAEGNSQWGSFAALQAGPWFYEGQNTQPTNNDYAVFLKSAEESGSGVEEQWRALFQKSGTEAGHWSEQYKMGSAFTDAQQKAIDSGITEGLVKQIGTNQSAIASLDTKLTEHATAADNKYMTKINPTFSGTMIPAAESIIDFTNSTLRVKEPTLDNEAATKLYVDTAIDAIPIIDIKGSKPIDVTLKDSTYTISHATKSVTNGGQESNITTFLTSVKADATGHLESYKTNTLEAALTALGIINVYSRNATDLA